MLQRMVGMQVCISSQWGMLLSLCLLHSFTEPCMINQESFQGINLICSGRLDSLNFFSCLYFSLCDLFYCEGLADNTIVTLIIFTTSTSKSLNRCDGSPDCFKVNVMVDNCIDWCTSENTVEQHWKKRWHLKPSLTVGNSHWTSSIVDSVPLLFLQTLVSQFLNKIVNLL